MNFDLHKLVRENITNLVPYSSARKEFAGAGEIFLDANENSFGSPLHANFNRYPDPLAVQIKEIVAEKFGLPPAQIFVGNGSDEAIDLLLRVFAAPGVDEIITTPPTYGMYEVSANINDVAVKRILLTADFELDADKILENVEENTKLIFLCSPNNPTGNSLKRAAVVKVLENFRGIVVVDEAYVHFSKHPSFISEIEKYPNLVVLQTFSKAWGLAGLRVGLAFASKEIIELINKVKPPYNLSQIAQQTLLDALENSDQVDLVVAEIIEQRELLAGSLGELNFVEQVFPSDANFLLVKMRGANQIYTHLIERGIVVRNRSNVELCENCLRITVGTPAENQTLIEALKVCE